MDAKTLVLQFNDCINNADINGLADLMTDDHVFIDTDNNRIEGKAENIDNCWKSFFRLYPGYQNIFESVTEKHNTIILQGYSVCSEEILNYVCAIWVAEIEDNKISLWHIYPDTKENRKMLGI